jgi:GT2 family glycosyltransferase
MYFEDADLLYRITAAGWQIHFTPATTVVHVGAASTWQHRGEMNVRLLTSTVQFYQRHAPSLHLLEVVLIIKGLMLARWISGTARLYLTRNPDKRAHIAGDMAASRRVLFGRQRGLVTGDCAS